MALKDITLGQFFPGDTPLHRLDPRTKLLLTMLQSISIAEVARTGTLALAKCSENDD